MQVGNWFSLNTGFGSVVFWRGKVCEMIFIDNEGWWVNKEYVKCGVES